MATTPSAAAAAVTLTTSSSSSSSTNVVAPRTEEIAAGARRLCYELAEFLEEHPTLLTASTVQAADKSEIPDLQLATCRQLREVRARSAGEAPRNRKQSIGCVLNILPFRCPIVHSCYP
jgi:hypothetical protein